jgi:hypothetical protein
MPRGALIIFCTVAAHAAFLVVFLWLHRSHPKAFGLLLIGMIITGYLAVCFATVRNAQQGKLLWAVVYGACSVAFPIYVVWDLRRDRK